MPQIICARNLDIPLTSESVEAYAAAIASDCYFWFAVLIHRSQDASFRLCLPGFAGGDVHCFMLHIAV